MKIHWARVVIAAFVIEIVLFVTLVPLGQAFGMPVFLVAVPIGCFVVAFLFTLWLTRSIQSRRVLHGLLIGLLATLLYMGLVVGSGQMAGALEIYGAVLFIVSNGLRVLGSVLGAFVNDRRV